MKDEKINFPIIIAAFVGILILLIIIVVGFAIPLIQEARPDGIGEKIDNCRDLIARALLVSDNSCQGISSNQACYGHNEVSAELVPDFSGDFNTVGDILPINGISNLQAAPLNQGNNSWGIALLKLPANLPGTLPGQNVTFMVFGNTNVENTSGDMSVFYFSNAITGVTCDQVAFDGLFIEMGDGTGIRFLANGVAFQLSGKAVFEAQPGQSMKISMYEGEGVINSGGIIQDLIPETFVNVPLDINLNPNGPPSQPQPLPEARGPGCHLLGIGCPLVTDTPIPSPTGTPPPPTDTLTPLPTDTPTQIIPTDTPPPTNTVPAVSTDTPAPTKTSVPTNTSAPTNTSMPTNTPEPSNTPTGTCSDIILGVGSTGGQFLITNNYISDVIIQEITLNWPTSQNNRWSRTRLNGVNIHSENLTESPSTIVLFASEDKRTVKIGGTNILEFIFQNEPADTGYNVTIKFDVGCVKARAQ